MYTVTKTKQIIVPPLYTQVPQTGLEDYPRLQTDTARGPPLSFWHMILQSRGIEGTVL